MSIKYVEGDLFAAVDAAKQAGRTIIIPHVCNDVGVWGAGFVIPLGRKYPNTRESYLKWYKEKTHGDKPFALGHVQFVKVEENPLVVVANMIAQHRVGGLRPLRYNALAHCMDEVASFSANSDIYAPLLGAGLAGGNWNFIRDLIEDCWLSRNLTVTVYYLPGMVPAEVELK
jgi:hypothetical protein